MHQLLRLAACPSAALFLLFSLALGGVAGAADPVAESMYQEGVELMKSGNFADACPKLDASQKLEPKSGTLVTLANCNEQIGKTATAWAQYKEAAALARKEGREDYAKKATELAGKLEGRLSKLRIDAQAHQNGADLTVQLDGKTVLTGTFGVAFAIDPGDHEISASAPGREPWSTQVTVGKDGDTKVVAVPQLEERAEPEPVVEPPPPTPTPEPVVPAPVPEPRPDEAEGGVPAWAWVAGAVGVVALGVAVVFAVDQASVASEIDDRCGGEARNLCPADYDFEAAHAREKRDFGLFIGLGAVGVAGVAVAIAGIAMGSGDSDDESALVVTPILGGDVAGVGVSGSF